MINAKKPKDIPKPSAACLSPAKSGVSFKNRQISRKYKKKTLNTAGGITELHLVYPLEFLSSPTKQGTLRYPTKAKHLETTPAASVTLSRSPPHAHQPNKLSLIMSALPILICMAPCMIRHRWGLGYDTNDTECTDVSRLVVFPCIAANTDYKYSFNLSFMPPAQSIRGPPRIVAACSYPDKCLILFTSKQKRADYKGQALLQAFLKMVGSAVDADRPTSLSSRLTDLEDDGFSTPISPPSPTTSHQRTKRPPASVNRPP